jgi:DNA topoisomerase-3
MMRQCLCKEDGAVHIVFKDGINKGRKFWKCTKGDGLACKFWEWDDEPPRSYGGSSGDAMPRSVSNGSSYNPTSGSGSDVCFKVRFLCYHVAKLLFMLTRLVL